MNALCLVEFLVAINVRGLLGAPASVEDGADLVLDTNADVYSIDQATPVRQKRDLAQLTELGINRLKDTKEKMFADYAFYGNHCGLGEKGNCVDATDDCCFILRKCHASNGQCKNPLSLVYHLKKPDLKCDQKKNDQCQQAICQCDVQAAECIAKNRGTFSKKYVGNRDGEVFTSGKPLTAPLFKTDRECPK